ncbi:hypothetical protein Agub_g7346, partial [Astrephomene gubernaculifera]
MHSLVDGPTGRACLGTNTLLRPIFSHSVAPFKPAGARSRQVNQARRPLVPCATSEASAEPIASTSGAPDVDKELVAEKTREGMRRFAASTRKVGVSRLVVDSLKRVSMTFLCDDHALGFEVAKIIGSRLGWFSVDLKKVICGMRKVASIEELSKEELVSTEAEVLRGLRNQFRVIACPLPGGAVTVRQEIWSDLYGSVIVWIDEEDRPRPKPHTPERQLYGSKAEVAVRVKLNKGFSQRSGNSLSTRAQAAAAALMNRLCDHLAEYPDLTDRKRRYVEGGCRGDWPAVQPPEWSPALQELAAARGPLAGFPQQQGAE